MRTMNDFGREWYASGAGTQEILFDGGD